MGGGWGGRERLREKREKESLRGEKKEKDTEKQEKERKVGKRNSRKGTSFNKTLAAHIFCKFQGTNFKELICELQGTTRTRQNNVTVQGDAVQRCKMTQCKCARWAL